MESVNTDNDDQMEITKMQNVQRITDIITMAKPSTSAKRAGAVANVKDIMANDKAMNLPEREVQALKTWNRINDYAKKSLPQLAEIGQVILDKRKSCTDDQSFAKAIEASPLAKIPYGQRKICMDLAEYWGKLKPLLGTEGYTSTSADLLVRKYKADNGIGTKRGAQTPKASKKSADKKTPVKTEMTKAQVLAMLQAAIKAGVIVKDDLKNIDWTVTK
jgi:hypothetical protein